MISESDKEVNGSVILISSNKSGSDKISGGLSVGSDTFQNGSDIIRYPTVILSPGISCITCLELS